MPDTTDLHDEAMQQIIDRLPDGLHLIVFMMSPENGGYRISVGSTLEADNVQAIVHRWIDAYDPPCRDQMQ